MTNRRKPVLKIKYDRECRFFFKMLQKNGTACEVNEHGINFSLYKKHTDQLWDDMMKWGYAFGRKTQTIQDMVDINNEEYRKEREERVKEANPTYSNGDPDRRE